MTTAADTGARGAVLQAEETEVLIVDDEPQVGDMLTDLLTQSGYRTTTVRRGWDAVHHLTERDIHVAVVDKNLPDLSGLEVIRLGLQASPETVFLIVTAYSSLETAMEAMDLGASAYVSKPFDLSAFLERIDLARRRASRNAIFKRMLANAKGGGIPVENPAGGQGGQKPPAPSPSPAGALEKLRTVHAAIADIRDDLHQGRMSASEAASALHYELAGMKRLLELLESVPGGGRSPVPSLEKGT